MNTTPQITLHCTEEQVAILLETIEALYSSTGGGKRTPHALAREVRDIERQHLAGNEPDDFAFMIARIAPVYLQLLKHAGKWSDPTQTGILLAENRDEFGDAIAEAKQALKSYGLNVPA